MSHKPPIYRDYSSTLTDVKAVLRQERKEALAKDLESMNTELNRFRDKAEVVVKLEAKVEGLTWLVRSVIVVAALEIVVGVVVALLMRGK